MRAHHDVRLGTSRASCAKKDAATSNPTACSGDSHAEKDAAATEQRLVAQQTSTSTDLRSHTKRENSRAQHWAVPPANQNLPPRDSSAHAHDPAAAAEASNQPHPQSAKPDAVTETANREDAARAVKHSIYFVVLSMGCPLSVATAACDAAEQSLLALATFEGPRCQVTDGRYFALPSKRALNMAERHVGFAKGLSIAATALVKIATGPRTAVNKAAKMMRYLHQAECLDRHFSEVGIDKWLEELEAAIGTAMLPHIAYGTSGGAESNSDRWAHSAPRGWQHRAPSNSPP